MDNKEQGHLFYLIGASGAGKDTLIEKLRQTCANDLFIARRYITRPSNAGGEEHIALTEKAFLDHINRDFFAMHWQAHGFYYGIAKEIEAKLSEGKDVLVNGSRAYLSLAQQKYASMLVPILLQVEPEILQQRLKARGRESEQQIAERLQRANEYKNTCAKQCFVIDNSGSIEQAVAQFITLRKHYRQDVNVGNALN